MRRCRTEVLLLHLLVWCPLLVTPECTSEEGDGTTIDCSLRILDFRRNSSDVPGVEKAKTINVVCSDVFFFESQLRSDHFGSLPDLRELSIKFCKIRQLPPRSFVSLERLSSLTVNTFNADWTSLELEPDYESLVGLKQLKFLDLSLNNVRRLPRGLLCPLEQVTTVNLSRNGIADLEDLGLSNRSREEHCAVPVERLILSRNEISSAPSGALAALFKLTHLDLSFNNLGVLVESTFKDLGGLEEVNLSHNRLVALPPKIFAATPELKELQLSNNSIGTIDLLAFRNLTRLQVLNLSGNSLDENWIKPGIFDGLRNLILLDLSANHISKVESKLFSDLTGLQVLSLSHNQIHTVASNAFVGQLNLHILLLSNNQLESLHHQTLNGLSVLNSLSLDHNRLHSLHPVALKNCTNLKDLSLSNNFLTQVPKALHQMPSIQSLDMSSNVIGVVKRESLQGLPMLHTLKISRNELSRIGEGAFKETPTLQHLDVSANRLQTVEQDTFKTLKILRSLNLAENQLKDVNGLLQAQVELQWLNVSSNRIAWFDYAFVPPSVQYLDISNNLIDALGNYYNLAENYALKYIDASANRIAAIDPLSLLPSMEDVYLEGNEISKIAENTFIGKLFLNQVHLERNQLTTLEMTSLMTSPLKATPMFYFGGNPFVCNCHLRWFSQINADRQLLRAVSPSSSASSSHFPRVVDIDRVSCSVLHNQTTVVVEKPLSQVSREEFLCRYDSHCLPGCMCCDFFACDCQIRCPREGCQCFRDAEWSTNIVQCSEGGHIGTLPEGVPMDASELYLDRNNFTALQPGMLVGRNRLKKLSVRHSHVATILNQTFAGLNDLQVLQLDHNQLQHLYGHEFHGLLNLRRLHLNNNQLVSIHQDTFKRLKRLTQLRLDNNLLISFPIWELSSNSALSSLTLANNWWQCDCDFVRKFRMFIDGKPEGVVEDAKSITCTSSESDESSNGGGGGGLREECSGILKGFQFERTFGGDIVPLAVSVAVIAVVAVIVLVAAFKMREAALIRLHDKYGIRIFPGKVKRDSSGDDEILFDALVIYSTKDEKLVVDELAKPLEHSYKLCLNHRDLSGIYTSEKFKTAIAASDWQIVVLSKGLLATEWDYVKDLILPNCMLVLVDSETPKADDVKTKEFIKSAKKVVRWKEADFWRKVRYYLPEPTKIATKEGGAELDVSGVWTFTNTNDVNNTTAASTAKLISSPMFEKSSYETNAYSGGTSMLAMLQQELLQQQNSFPAPPVRKQPHQCSTHYLAGAPSSPPPVPATRSCGTNAITGNHQRSSSAILSKKSSFNHARSASYASHVAPPTRLRTEGELLHPAKPVYDPASYAHRLQQSTAQSPMALVRSSSPPMSSLAMIPLRANNLHNLHQRSTSLLDPSATGATGVRYAKHGRSASNLSPMNAVGTPRILKSSTPVTRAASMLNARGVRAPMHHKSASNIASYEARPQPQGASSNVAAAAAHQHQSFSSLNPAFNGSAVLHPPPVHYRSKSTPHEGFVL